MTVVAYRNRNSQEYPVTLEQLRTSSGLLFGDAPSKQVLDFSGFDEVHDSPRPSFDPAVQVLLEFPPVKSNGVWVQSWGVQDIPPAELPSLEQAKDEALARLADIRWQHEEGGSRMPNGTSVATDRVSQAKITAAYTKAKQDSNYKISNWKTGPGQFITLPANLIIMIGDWMEKHVQMCFDHEAELTRQILAAKTTPEVLAVDLNKGWPSV